MITFFQIFVTLYRVENSTRLTRMQSVCGASYINKFNVNKVHFKYLRKVLHIVFANHTILHRLSLILQLKRTKMHQWQNLSSL